jgi:hypothetical protein
MIYERASSSRLTRTANIIHPPRQKSGLADQADLKALCAMRTAGRTYARLGAEGHRRASRPPLERTVEGANL